MSSQWFVNPRCWVRKSKGGSSGPHWAADSTWNGKHWVLTPLRATKILRRKLSWASVRTVRSGVGASPCLQWGAGSTGLKVVKATLVDKISRYNSKLRGKRDWARAWRVTRYWSGHSTLAAGRAAPRGEEGFLSCCFRSEPPVPEHCLPHLVFQAIEWQGLGSPYVLQWGFSRTKCHSSRKLNTWVLQMSSWANTHILYNLLSNTSR